MIFIYSLFESSSFGCALKFVNSLISYDKHTGAYWLFIPAGELLRVWGHWITDSYDIGIYEQHLPHVPPRDWI